MKAFAEGGFTAATVGYAVESIVAHGLVGGVMSELSGGNFGDGFIGAGLSTGLSLTSLIDGKGFGYSAARIALAAVAGGTASELTGGKFGNGAVSAAFSQAFNEEAHYGKEDDFSLPSAPQELVDAVAGFGDSFGAGYIRRAFGIDGGINYDSGFYLGGEVVGTLEATVLGAGIGARGAAYLGKIGGGTKWGHWINHNRYLRMGPGRMPANGGLPAGPKVPRMSIGPQRSGFDNPHVDLRVRPWD